jgi:hypothetical protein
VTRTVATSFGFRMMHSRLKTTGVGFGNPPVLDALG